MAWTPKGTLSIRLLGHNNLLSFGEAWQIPFEATATMEQVATIVAGLAAVAVLACPMNQRFHCRQM